MRLGVLLIPTDPWPVSVARARHLEQAGFDALWTYDHLSWQRYREEPWLGAVPWLAGIAAATRRIRIGTMVSSPNFRHPVTLAKDAMTIDVISDGRMSLGIGAGGTGFDATVFGDEVPSSGERAQRLADFVAVTDGLLRSAATYSTMNSRYPVVEAAMRPGCVQRPRLPLVVAAGGPRTIATAARFADCWLTEGDPAEAARQVALVDRACAAAGRDPASLRRMFLISNRFDRPLRSLAAFRACVQRFEALGFTDLVFHDPRPADPFWDDDPAIVDDIAAEFGLPGPSDA